MMETSKRKDSQGSSVDEDKPFIGLRWIVVLILFLTNMTTFFVRNSLSVTVVAMINSTSNDEQNNTKDACPAALNETNSSDSQRNGEFNWTAGEQGFVLGAYYWGFVLSRLFLTRLGEIIGQRETFSISAIGSGILSFISPPMATLSPYALAANRFMTGIFQGPIAGASVSLLAVWAPKSELALMNATSFSGAMLGLMLGTSVAGWLSNNFSWSLIFYVGGVVSFIILPLWIFLVKNSPFEHPWLSNHERKLLIENINIKTKKSVPWFKLITSPYVLLCIYALFARMWLDNVLNTDAPSFLRYKIGLDLNTASFVTGANNFFGFPTLLLFGWLSDYIMNKNYLSKIHTRKFFHAIGTIGPSVLLIGVIIADCNSTVIIIMWLLMGGICSGTAVGFSLSIYDLAPNYTATVNGLLALGTLAGAIAPSVTSALIKQDNGWNNSFYLCIGLNLISCVLYVIFMTAEPQPWNFEDEDKNSENNFVTKL